MGNPIEIAEVVVWRVSDTAKALFDVDDYDNYVAMQSRRRSGTSLQHLQLRPHGGLSLITTPRITLRSSIEEVSEALPVAAEPPTLSVAGITVDDAHRLTHPVLRS